MRYSAALLATGLLAGCTNLPTVQDMVTDAVPSIVTTTTTTTTTTQPASGDIGIVGLPWEIAGFSGAGSVLDPGVTITDYSLSMTALSWTITGTESWPNDGNTYGLDCLWTRPVGGVWHGGKFDWSRKGKCVRPTSAHVQGNGSGFYRVWGLP